MKKSILAVIMAIVMLLSVVTVYAYDNYVPEEEAIESLAEVCPFCGGAQKNKYCTSEYGTANYTQRCTEHPNVGCVIHVFVDSEVTACRDCGYVFGVTNNHMHITHVAVM